MLISIVIPIYNTSKYLSKSIQSVINQSYREVEIILIDDGSTDKSLEICHKYEVLDERIRVFSKENEGLGLTRNFGLKKSKGEYVLFVDSDDELDSDHILKLIEFIKKNNNPDVVISGYTRIDSLSKFISKYEYDVEHYCNEDIKNKLLPKLFGSLPELSDSISVSSCGNAYKLATILKKNINFPSEREYVSEDLVFNLNLFLECDNIIISNATGYYYRFNEGSLTKAYLVDRFEKIKKMYAYQLDIINMLYSREKKEECKIRLSKQFFLYLRMCFRQEDTQISKKKFIKAIVSISEICKDDLTKQIINNYPVRKLNIKQRIFVYFVKYSLAILIYTFVKVGVIE